MTRLIYLPLMLIGLALLLFLGGFVLAKLGLSLLTGLLFAIASKVLLIGLALWLLWIVLKLLQASAQPIARYFQKNARAQRYWYFLQLRLQDQSLRQGAQRLQLGYVLQRKRQHLAARNDRQQLKALFKSIRQELRAKKRQTPAVTYQRLSKQLQQSLKQADIAAMLAVRQQLS